MLAKCRKVASVAAGAIVTSGILPAGPAAADPAPPPAPPPLPDVNSYLPISPVDYAAMGGTWYAFAGPAGITCVIIRQSSSYGCSGPLPGAPEGANLVSGGPVGAPSFAVTDRPNFAAAGEVKPLPPNTRLSFRDISCGVDGAGVLACVNTREQVGFIVTDTGTFIDDTSPLVGQPGG